MPCIHNVRKINELNKKIKLKNMQIESIEKLKEDVNKISENHGMFVKELDCVVKNLEGNTVVANREYDDGKMTECMDEANEEILRCDAILKASDEKIESIKLEIEKINSQIDSLQGDCEYCLTIKSRMQFSSKKMEE